MMHHFLRSVGFAGAQTRDEIQRLVGDTVQHADFVRQAKDADGISYVLFYKLYAKNMGLAVCGAMDENESFFYEYYFPFLYSDGISTAEEISLDRLSSQVGYAGLVDETRIGVSLIFYLRNMADYMERLDKKRDALKGASLSLAALSDGGTILMPVMKSVKERNFSRKKAAGRYRLIAAAKKGNEEAMETLTLEDMDTYTAVSKKIKESDVFTLVDTYFMPFGVECDHYSVLGEIVQCEEVENVDSKERICLMKLLCNDMYFDLCVNTQDLTGEPKKGRRFKGNIWLQGGVNFVD